MNLQTPIAGKSPEATAPTSRIPANVPAAEEALATDDFGNAIGAPGELGPLPAHLKWKAKGWYCSHCDKMWLGKPTPLCANTDCKRPTEPRHIFHRFSLERVVFIAGAILLGILLQAITGQKGFLALTVAVPFCYLMARLGRRFMTGGLKDHDPRTARPPFHDNLQVHYLQPWMLQPFSFVRLLKEFAYLAVAAGAALILLLLGLLFGLFGSG